MVVCASCGQENPDIARFCLACGLPLSNVTGSATEERRLVSVIFVDMVGFTARAERLDPEEVQGLLRPYYDVVRREIESFGGVVEKFIGDAVVGLFGAPVAHGDDAERAVRAALAVRDSIAAMDEADPRLDLKVRIAVNTGEALVIVKRGRRSARRWSRATWSTPRRASSRQRRSAVSSSARRPIGRRGMRSSTRPPIPVEAKGKEDRVPAWIALRETRLPGERPRRSMLVGRGPRARPPARHLGARRRRAHVPPRHRDRPRGCRQDPARGRVRGDGAEAGRPVRHAAACSPTARAPPTPPSASSSSSYAGSSRPTASRPRVRSSTGWCRRSCPRTEVPEVTQAPRDPARARPGRDGRRPREPLLLDPDVHRGGRRGPADDARLRRRPLGRRGAARAGRPPRRRSSVTCPVLILALARPELLDLRPDWGGGLPAHTALPLRPLDPAEATELATNRLVGRRCDPRPRARGRPRDRRGRQPALHRAACRCARGDRRPGCAAADDDPRDHRGAPRRPAAGGAHRRC